MIILCFEAQNINHLRIPSGRYYAKVRVTTSPDLSKQP